jgi:hypothetical protein
VESIHSKALHRSAWVRCPCSLSCSFLLRTDRPHREDQGQPEPRLVSSETLLAPAAQRKQLMRSPVLCCSTAGPTAASSITFLKRRRFGFSAYRFLAVSWLNTLDRSSRCSQELKIEVRNARHRAVVLLAERLHRCVLAGRCSMWTATWRSWRTTTIWDIATSRSGKPTDCNVSCVACAPVVRGSCALLTRFRPRSARSNLVSAPGQTITEALRLKNVSSFCNFQLVHLCSMMPGRLLCLDRARATARRFSPCGAKR